MARIGELQKAAVRVYVTRALRAALEGADGAGH
jgi:hypothetical protein